MKDPIRVTSATRYWKSIRRLFARNEWIIWLLGLKRTTGKSTDRGLILVQIDGLSKTQLERALKDNKIPFLKSLLDNENYVQHTFYSGLPSSTPAVQGELYYGHRTIVPAFGFRDHRSGRLVRMFANDIAQEVENEMSVDVEGLLSGGSSYANIYGGGAEDVYFCATSFGWSEFFKAANPIKFLIVLVLNFWMFFRVFGLMVVEFFVATLDFVRGVLSGRQFWQELIMIPARVVVVVLLRELVTIGACFDSARGLPIIHLNLLGYDEQAHRRGPGSKSAHWSLKAIDKSIKRIWQSAHQGAGREYDLWIFSDHGQEATNPYQLEHGKLIQQAVADIVDASCPSAEPSKKLKLNRLPTRANWLGFGWLVSMLFGEQDHDIQSRSPNVHTVTSGPIGFVYLLNDAIKQKCDELADRFVNELHVPMTVRQTGHHQALVTTREGNFLLPDQAVQVFGADHPFLDDVAEDMIRLARHKNAGDLVLVGWTHESESTSFVLQNGAHAGPGIEETRGFAMLPSDILLPITEKRYLRPDDLRRTALHFLERDIEEQPPRESAFPRDGRIRMMTYNVHACVGMDGLLSPERIARVIAQSGADVICLQELDVFRHRSGNRDQAHAIAQALEMSHQFHPAWHLEEEQFGNAILTRYPLRVIEAKGLHHHKSDRSRRSALWVEIDITDDISLQIINTHLSIYTTEQKIQAAELIEAWVQPASLLGPVILCGDFNARPNSATCKTIQANMKDVESFDNNRVRATLFSPFPLTRVDHVFVTPGLHALGTEVIESRIAKIASDHLPLVCDLKVVLSEYEAAKSNGVDQIADT